MGLWAWPVGGQVASCMRRAGVVQEGQDIMVETLSRHVLREAAHVVPDVLLGSVLEKEASHFVAPFLGSQEQRGLCLWTERASRIVRA